MIRSTKHKALARSFLAFHLLFFLPALCWVPTALVTTEEEPVFFTAELSFEPLQLGSGVSFRKKAQE